MPKRLPAALLCAPLCLAIGCFQEPETVPDAASTGTVASTGDSGDSTTQAPGDTTGDADSTTKGEAEDSTTTTGFATFGATGDTDVCEVENRTSDPFFDEWVNDMTPAEWVVGEGIALRIPNGAGDDALRMARNLPAAGSGWTFGQEVFAPFEPGGTYEVEIRYRKTGGLDAATQIHVELDGAGFASDNIPVAPGPEWKDDIAVLTLRSDVDGRPPESLPLLISSFDSDQVIEFDSVLFFEACFPSR